MLSQIAENYLKAIYFLDQNKSKITLTDISKSLEVSTPTGNNMVKRLKDFGLVEYEKYQPIKFTSKGRKIAANIVRKHRLTEMFLTKFMGFGWEEVHDIAEEMEHINSDKLFDKMDELMGYPTVDPHGSPIPNKKGEITSNEYHLLSSFKEGRTVRICSLKDSSVGLLKFLNGKGIKLGTEMKIVEKEPFDNSIVVSYGEQSSVMLSQEVSGCLLVEEVTN